MMTEQNGAGGDNLVDPVISADQTPPRTSTLAVEWRRMYEEIRPTTEPPETPPNLRPGLPPILRDAMNAVTNGDSPWPLVMIGEAGAGKTCAALLMLYRWAELGAHVYYSLAAGYAERVRLAKLGELEWQTITAHGKLSEANVVDEWGRPPLAVLEEVGTRDKASDFQCEVVQRCIDGRLGRPTVYTSNLKLEVLEQVYTDRIASRLSAGTIVYVKGDQRRGRSLGTDT